MWKHQDKLSQREEGNLNHHEEILLTTVNLVCLVSPLAWSHGQVAMFCFPRFYGSQISRGERVAQLCQISFRGSEPRHWHWQSIFTSGNLSQSESLTTRLCLSFLKAKLRPSPARGRQQRSQKRHFKRGWNKSAWLSASEWEKYANVVSPTCASAQSLANSERIFQKKTFDMMWVTKKYFETHMLIIMVLC